MAKIISCILLCIITIVYNGIPIANGGSVREKAATNDFGAMSFYQFANKKIADGLELSSPQLGITKFRCFKLCMLNDDCFSLTHVDGSNFCTIYGVKMHEENKFIDESGSFVYVMANTTYMIENGLVDY